jgi:hypothetical protein
MLYQKSTGSIQADEWSRSRLEAAVYAVDLAINHSLEAAHNNYTIQT